MSFTLGYPSGRPARPGTISDMVLSPPGGKMMKIADSLPRDFSAITPILTIIRDYIPGHFLLMTDLFPKRDFTLHEAYSLLYSVACCHQCTEEVMIVLRKCKIKSVPERSVESMIRSMDIEDEKIDVPIGKRFNMNYMGKFYNDSLTCRYVAMRNMKSLDLLHGELTKMNATFINDMKSMIVEHFHDRAVDGKEVCMSPPCTIKIEDKLDIYGIVRRCLEGVDTTFDEADPTSFGGTVFHSNRIKLPLFSMCANLLKDCGVGILGGGKRMSESLKILPICDMIMKAVMYALKGDDVVKALRSIRKRFATRVYYSSLWNVVTAPCAQFARRDEHHLIRREDLVMASLCIYDSISMREYTESITEALIFLWKLPTLLLEKHCTIIGKRVTPSNYPSITVNYEGKNVDLSLCLTGGNQENYIPAYEYNNETLVPYHLLLYIVADKFIWSYDRDFILLALRRFHKEEDIATLEATSYENPIHHVIVPIKSITVQSGVIH